MNRKMSHVIDHKNNVTRSTVQNKIPCGEVHVHALPHQGDADSRKQCSPTNKFGFPVDL